MHFSLQTVAAIVDSIKQNMSAEYCGVTSAWDVSEELRCVTSAWDVSEGLQFRTSRLGLQCGILL